MPENGNKTNGKFKKLCQTTTFRSLYLPLLYMYTHVCVCVGVCEAEKKGLNQCCGTNCVMCRDLTQTYRPFLEANKPRP